MLVALAITTLVGISITSVLLAIETNARRDVLQTDAYEALRLAAHQVMQDGRFASVADTFDQGAKLRLDVSGGDYILYTFESYNFADPTVPIPDPTNLHRWVMKGGTVTDEVLATNLLTPGGGSTNRTKFSVDEIHSGVEAILVREPLSGQETPIRIKVFVHFR